MFKILFTLHIILISSFAQADQPVLDIDSGDIDRIRIHTTFISPSAQQNVVTVKTTKMKHTDNSCASGGYITLEDNQATYSAMLAAFLAGKNFSIMYDTEQHYSASNAYCAILYFDVLK